MTGQFDEGEWLALSSEGDSFPCAPTGNSTVNSARVPAFPASDSCSCSCSCSSSDSGSGSGSRLGNGKL